MMIFHEDKNILCIATKQETAKNMVTKVKFMYESLPSWLKFANKPDEANKLTLRLPNGSQIKAIGASADAGRSEAVSLLIIDEAAFIENISENDSINHIKEYSFDNYSKNNKRDLGIYMVIQNRPKNRDLGIF
jgi:phage terminase large subunit GpA-like protein